MPQMKPPVTVGQRGAVALVAYKAAMSAIYMGV